MTFTVQGVMVRLMLVLAPVMCILSGIAVSATLTAFMKNLDVSRKEKKTKKRDTNYPIKNEVSTLNSIYYATQNSTLSALKSGSVGDG